MRDIKTIVLSRRHILAGVTAAALVLALPRAFAASDPLASWNDGQIMLSGYHDLTDTIAIMGNVVWQQWSEFGQPSLEITSRTSRSATADLGYNDTWGFALGTRYKFAPDWLWSVGVAFDTSPMSKSQRTPALPLDQQIRVGTGLQYALNDRATIGAAYFWIDRHEATNAQFRRFVEATGYATMAERGLDAREHPDLPPELTVPGSMMFTKPDRVRDPTDITQWWRYLPGADWRHPEGPASSIDGKGNRPVVHVAHEDALAYARWLGHDLPTEAEWEFAARGGLDGAIYTWGDSYDHADGWRANTWQGSFPVRDDAADGYSGTAPVGCFPPNGYGLLDMAGDVWEYTRDRFAPGHSRERAMSPTGPDARAAERLAGPAGPSVAVKGGSWLCSPDFCLRYRPAARQPQELSLGSNHIGFRTVWRVPAPKEKC